MGTEGLSEGEERGRREGRRQEGAGAFARGAPAFFYGGEEVIHALPVHVGISAFVFCSFVHVFFSGQYLF